MGDLTILNLPVEMLAKIVTHTAQLSVVTAMRLHGVCRQFRLACEYSKPVIDICGGLGDYHHDDIILLHLVIAKRFPRLVGLKTKIVVDSRFDVGEHSINSLAKVVSSATLLRELSIQCDDETRHYSIDKTHINWQRKLADAIGNRSRLVSLDLNLPAGRLGDSDMAEFFRRVGSKLNRLSLSGCWIGHEALAVISPRFMPKLNSITLDPALMTYDMAGLDASDTLISDVLVACRYHWRQAELDTSRLAEFIGHYGTEFVFNGRRLLSWAAMAGNLSFVRVLLSKGAVPSGTTAESSTTPLIAATDAGHTEIAEELIRAGADTNEPSGSHNRIALHLAVGGGKVGMVRLLLKHGANVNAIGRGGMTALCIAARKGFADVVDILVEHGAVVNTDGVDTRQPLDVACEFGQDQCVDRLLHHGASVESQNDEPNVLFKSISREYVGVCNKLLAGGSDPNSVYDGVTALGYAVQVECIPIVALLLNAGAEVNLKTRYMGSSGILLTPLHYAARIRRFAIADLLLSRGADPSILGGDGSSPLHCAVQNKDTGMVGLLLQYDTDPSLAHGITGKPALPVCDCM